VRPQPGNSWLGLLLLWPLLAFMDQSSQTPHGGVAWFGALGAALGVVAWRASLHFGWKARATLLSLLALWLVGLGAVELCDSLAWLPALLGPDRWVLGRQYLQALLTMACWIGALRSLSWRYPPLALLELAFAANLFVSALSAHREGFINRPFQVVDRLWLKGLDPTPMFLAVGVVALLATVLLASNRPGNRRPWWDLPALTAVLVAFFLLLPTPRIHQMLEKFGLGNQPGSENRLRPPGSGKSNQEKNQGKGGGSEQKEPSFANSQQPPKPQPVAVVIFRDDYEPPSGVYYFRQHCNSLFNGLKLVRSNDNRFDQDTPQRFPTREFRRGIEAEDLGLKLPHLEEPFCRPLKTRVALMTQHSKPFGLDTPVGFWATGNPDPARFQKAYDVDSMVFQGEYVDLLECPAGDMRWDTEVWAHYLAGPKDPRYQQLADEITAKLPPERRHSPLFKAVAIKLWLDENTTYSLNSPSAQAPDPVADYLFGQRIGYCVYTSHSACYLYRAAGIPARIANGYAVNAQQRGGGSSLLIRSNEAHSWPEIYLHGVGWLELDIAPKTNLEPESEQVDNNLQQMMGDMARKDKKEKRPEEDRPRVDLQEMLAKIVSHLLQALPWALLATWLALTAWKWGRRWLPWFVSGPGLARAAYVCVLDMLAERGIVRSRFESQEAFARRLQDTVPDLLPLTLTHLQARLGQGEPTRDAVRQHLRQCLRQVRRQRGLGWRRWLGWLDATSGFRVR